MTISEAINAMIRLTGLCILCWLVGYLWQEHMLEQPGPEVTRLLSPDGQSIASYQINITRKLLKNKCEREIWLETKGLVMTYRPERVFMETCDPRYPYDAPVQLIWLASEALHVRFFTKAQFTTGKSFVVIRRQGLGGIKISFKGVDSSRDLI